MTSQVNHSKSSFLWRRPLDGFQNETSVLLSTYVSLFNHCRNTLSTSICFAIVRARCSSVVRAFVHGKMGRRIDPSWWTHWAISRSHDWCNKGRGMCYPVCGMMHIKEPLLLIEKSSICGGSQFPLSLYHMLSEWSFTICTDAI